NRAPRGLRCFPSRRSSDLATAGWTGHGGRDRIGGVVHVGPPFEGDGCQDAAGSCSNSCRELHDPPAAAPPPTRWRRPSSTAAEADRKSTRLNSSHVSISYA